MVKLSSFPPIPDFSYLQGVGIWYPLSLAVCQRPQLQPHGIVTAGSTVLNDLKMRRGKCGWKYKNMRTSQSPALFVHSHVPSFVFHKLGMKIPHFGTKTSNKWPSHLDPVPWNSHCRASEHATDRCRVLVGPTTAIKISHLPRWVHFQCSSREKSGLESGRQVVDTASISTQIPLQVSPTKRFQDFHCEWNQAFMIVLFGKAPKAYTNFRIYMSIHIYMASLSATNNAMRQRRTLWILETIPCHKLPPFSRGCWSYQVLVASSARVVLNTKMQATWPNCFNP